MERASAFARMTRKEGARDVTRLEHVAS